VSDVAHKWRQRNFWYLHAVAGSAAGESGEERFTPSEYEFPQRGNPGTGSSGIGGIETVVLKGNPDQGGVYTIMLRVPAHTRIAAHSHRDDRVATVISGTWHIGYGDRFDEAKLKALPAGSFLHRTAVAESLRGNR
jgi:hypothetical protein